MIIKLTINNIVQRHSFVFSLLLGICLHGDGGDGDNELNNNYIESKMNIKEKKMIVRVRFLLEVLQQFRLA